MLGLVQVERIVTNSLGHRVPPKPRHEVPPPLCVRLNVETIRVELFEDHERRECRVQLAVRVPERDSGRSHEIRFGKVFPMTRTAEADSRDPLVVSRWRPAFSDEEMVREALREMILHEVDEAIVKVIGLRRRPSFIGDVPPADEIAMREPLVVERPFDPHAGEEKRRSQPEEDDGA
jgi:hypothetical protein